MKEEALRKEWFLPEGKTYLGLLVKLARGHFLPSGIPAPDMEGDRTVLTASESQGKCQLPPGAL